MQQQGSRQPPSGLTIELWGGAAARDKSLGIEALEINLQLFK